MQLTKLYIHNYKSFYDTTLEFKKFNIVVGENNSGKSNLVNVLEFLDIGLFESIPKAILEKGGLENIQSYDESDKIIIRADFILSEEAYALIGEDSFQSQSKDSTVVIKISISKTFYQVTASIKQEIMINKEIPLGKYSDISFIISSKVYYENTKNKNTYRKYYISDKNYLERYGKNIIKSISLLNFLNNNKGMIFRHKSIETYYFDVNSIRNNSTKENVTMLKKDGANLGKNLYNIKERDSNKFDIISNSLIGIVNEIDSIDIQKVAGSYIIIFNEGDNQLNINTVSDGTINLLSTITALNKPYPTNFLSVFEEPERHLHLKAINYIMDSFRADSRQIIVTTHSTEILKKANFDEVIFIYRDENGDTKSIRADKIPNLEVMMKELSYEREVSLDELISDGIIGDFE